MIPKIFIGHSFLSSPEILVLTPTGHLDHLTAYQLFDYFERARTEKRCGNIILSLGKINYLGSKGFGVILKIHKHLIAEGGEIVLTEAQPFILDSFMMLNLHKVIKYFIKFEDAVEYFKLKG